MLIQGFSMFKIPIFLKGDNQTFSKSSSKGNWKQVECPIEKKGIQKNEC